MNNLFKRLGEMTQGENGQRIFTRAFGTGQILLENFPAIGAIRKFKLHRPHPAAIAHQLVCLFHKGITAKTNRRIGNIKKAVEYLSG